jgi:RecA/RadA recombinase
MTAKYEITTNTVEYRKSLLRYMIRDEAVLSQAIKCGVKSKHFEPFAMGIVQGAAADLMVGVGKPLDKDTLQAELLRAPGILADQVIEVVRFTFEGDLSAREAYVESIPHFVKETDQALAHDQYRATKDNDGLRNTLIRIELDFRRQTGCQRKSIRRDIFQAAVTREINNHVIPLGFDAIDKKLDGGLARGEYALLVGHRGSGKTALAIDITCRAVKKGYKVAFFSFEMPCADVSTRMCGNLFEIEWSEVFAGRGIPLLKDIIARPENAELVDKFIHNLALMDAQSVGRLNTDAIYDYLVQEQAQSGFVPDLVIIDQMQFLLPCKEGADAAQWQIEEQISKECDDLSHKTIAGQKSALIVLHQATGDVKDYYGRSDLKGYKSVDNVPDWVFCIGRKDFQDPHVSFFSQKCRRCEHFKVALTGNLKYARFEEFKTNCEQFQALHCQPDQLLNRNGGNNEGN